MPTVNEILQDEYIAHALDLQKYSNGVIRRIIALLNRADADLVNRLHAAIDSLPPESFTVGRLEALLVSVRALNSAAYTQVFEALNSELLTFAEYESDWNYKLIDSAVPRPIKIRFPTNRVTAAQVKAAALSRPFQGRLLKEWASNVEEGRMQAVRNNIRTGFVEGKTPSEIVRGIKGTRANSYADGLLERPRRELMTVTQTAISHTAARAREEVYKANDDVVKAVRWIATLDSKTTHQCSIRDQKTYTIDHKPIGHKYPWLGGPGIIHFNCRSADAPVTASWKELGFDESELEPGTRASMDGQVPEETDFGTWISRQSEARQIKNLGKVRTELLRSGKAKFEDFYNNRGEWLTIDQLKKSDEEIFKALAG